MISNEEIYKSRDVTTAEEVAQLMELKYFDEQFLYYGTAYAEEGRVKYRLNRNGMAIYDFLISSARRNVYPIGVETYVQLIRVPSGKEEILAAEVRENFVEKLKATYPKEIFQALNRLGHVPPTDQAKGMLQQWQEELELCYDPDEIQLYAEVVQEAFVRKLLCAESLEQLQRWAGRRQEQIRSNEHPIWREKRCIYGFLYRQNGNFLPYSNAEKQVALERRYTLQCKGVFCTPIFAKEYWIDTKPDQSMLLWRKQFEEEMRSRMTGTYLDRLQMLRDLETPVSSAYFRAQMGKIDVARYPSTLPVIRFYANQWCPGILSGDAAPEGSGLE